MYVMEKTELCLLAEKYKTDKCRLYRHNYTPYYYALLSPYRESIKDILEIGVGFPGKPGSNVMEHVANLGYKKGGSLYMWREFFPKAQIVGLDIHPEAMFTDESIQTFLSNQTDEETIQRNLAGKQFDFIIDDGSHNLHDQQKSFDILFPFLRKDGIYIIEDMLPLWTPDIKDHFIHYCKDVLLCKEAKVYDIRADSNFVVEDDVFIFIQK
jgi:hypothetical protein